jgi:hypothetical protein
MYHGTLNIGAAVSSEMLVNICKITCYHILEDSNLQTAFTSIVTTLTLSFTLVSADHFVGE